jgi:hypothetical protein
MDARLSRLIDGFDAGRLQDFARTRLADYGFESDEDIALAVRRAADAGEQEFSGYLLYYLTARAQGL